MGRITRVATQIADISATQKVFWRPHPDSSSDTRKAESKRRLPLAPTAASLKTGNLHILSSQYSLLYIKI